MSRLPVNGRTHSDSNARSKFAGPMLLPGDALPRTGLGGSLSVGVRERFAANLVALRPALRGSPPKRSFFLSASRTSSSGLGSTRLLPPVNRVAIPCLLRAIRRGRHAGPLGALPRATWREAELPPCNSRGVSVTDPLRIPGKMPWRERSSPPQRDAEVGRAGDACRVARRWVRGGKGCLAIRTGGCPRFLDAAARFAPKARCAGRGRDGGDTARRSPTLRRCARRSGNRP